MDDMPELFRMLAALTFVLALMGGLLIFLRKFGLAGQNIGGKRRLRLVEVLSLDTKRKLAIVECDKKQHLLVLGPGGETLIESNLESAQDSLNDKPDVP